MDVSTYIEKDLQHSQVLLNNEPDCGYEYFWLNFKDSITNASLCSLPKEISDSLQELSGQVPVITDKLNDLQKKRNYNEIFSCINGFLNQYFWLILAEGEYHSSIATTNFKRWIKLCELRSLNPVPGFKHHNPLEESDKYPNMKFIYLLHKCCTNRSTTSHKIKQSVLSVIRNEIEPHQIFGELFKEAVSSKSYSIVNKYLELYPKESVLLFKDNYNINIPFGVKNSNKILKQIN